MGKYRCGKCNFNCNQYRYIQKHREKCVFFKELDPLVPQNLNFLKNDNRKNLLFIGANFMLEINNYVSEYKNGLFIEGIPYVCKQLQINLDKTKKYNTNYKAINSLITNKVNEEYEFNIFNNDAGSSSIFKPNMKNWEWDRVRIKDNIILKSNTIENILKDELWENIKFDVILDVQGAELLVLNGFSKKNLKNIGKIEVEISKKEYYKGGVLFDELNKFFIDNNFKLISDINKINNHDNVIYINTINLI